MLVMLSKIAFRTKKTQPPLETLVFNLQFFKQYKTPFQSFSRVSLRCQLAYILAFVTIFCNGFCALSTTHISARYNFWHIEDILNF